MEELEKMKAWVVGFPLWGQAALTVDATGAEPGCCGLFPVGLEQLSIRETVLGTRHIRYRQQFLLRRSAVRGEDAAAWLLEFQKWVALQGHAAPVFGQQQTVRAEKGRLINAAQTGTGLYEVRIIFEFTKGE